MEFDEIQKVWDQQNQQAMYIIDEATMHKRIHTLSQKASRVTHINETGLMLIAVGTAALLILLDYDSIFTYLSALALLLIGGYVWWGKIQRQKQEKQYDQTILGELDQAIANATKEIKRARTFVWWFLLPVALPTFLNMANKGVSPGKWLLIIGAFVLSLAVTQYGLKRTLEPRKRKLEAMRAKLTEEVSEKE